MLEQVSYSDNALPSNKDAGKFPNSGILTMRTGASASVGVVTELMNMHAPLGRGIVAFDIPSNVGW